MSLKPAKIFEDTLIDKLTTFGRRRKIKEAEEAESLVKDGVLALETPCLPQPPDIPPSEYILEENEERCMIDPKSREDPKTLNEWINDELSLERILVKDLEEDLYDGQVLGKLIEKLANIKLDLPEVTQTEEGRRHKLKIVIAAINHVLDIPYNHNLWSIEAIRSKDLIAILRICLALAFKFVPADMIRTTFGLSRTRKVLVADGGGGGSGEHLFPDPLNVTVLVVRKEQGLLRTRRHIIDLIGSAYSASIGRPDYSRNRPSDNVDYYNFPEIYNFEHPEGSGILPLQSKRDAFDTLFEHAPEKLGIVQKSLLTFARKHLNELDIDIQDLHQFYDGVLFILLISQLEGYFVPLYAYYYEPENEDERIHNINFGFDLIQEAGIPKSKLYPEDIAIRKDLKAILRVLYALFAKYKHL